MSPLLESPTLLAEVWRQAEEAVQQAARCGPGRVEVCFPPAFRFPFAAADGLAIFPKFYWQARHCVVRRLALGAVWRGETPIFPQSLSKLPGDELCGGQAFAASAIGSPEWAGFGAAIWFLPALEIVASTQGTRLRIRWEDTPPWDALELLQNFLETAPSRVNPTIPEAWARLDVPNFHAWRTAVGQALERIEQGELQKLVLARCSTFELSEAAAPFGLLEALTKLAPDCFHFLLAAERGLGAFFGASPELLYAREGRRLQTEAIAGTRPRNLDPAEEERMEAELLGQAKELREHAIVVQALQDALADLCEEQSTAPEPQILKLQRVQHLHTPLRGVLRNGVGDAEILSRLHPTPATCGMPKSASLAALQNLENFSRGWYAGPVGWIGEESATVCVAIRSLRLRGAVLMAYAGAGIVPGSDAEKEWAELESKIGGILRMLSL